jgi:hypothetical protein
MEQQMKRTAVGLAAVAALGVAALVPSVGQSQASRTITLDSHTKSLKVVDLPPRGKSSAGDVVVAVSTLRNADGVRAGTGYLNCALTGRARTFESANYACTGTDKLRDGTITYAGAARLAAHEITVAVTGGTGAYDGASGNLVNTNTGNDDARQVITLK